MSKTVYRQSSGHDPGQTFLYPAYESDAAWSRCDFDGRAATVEVLILHDQELRLSCDACAARPNVTTLIEEEEN